MVQFTTARLVVRLYLPEDAAAVAAYRSDLSVARYVPWGPDYSPERAAEMIRRVQGRDFDTAGASGINMAVVQRSDDRVIGEAMIKHDDDDARLGIIGYALARDAHGKGLGSELTTGLIDRFFAGPQAHRVSAWCDARNVASIRVLEKAGMRLEAEFRQGVYCKGEWVNERVYAMLRSEWLARRPVNAPAPG